MKRIAGSAVMSLLLVASLGFGCFGFDAELGVCFADAYGAFAPLFVFHRSYADHLFLGANVEIPMNLVESCQSFSFRLGLLQIELIEQTASAMPETMHAVLRLRMEQAVYCDRHAAMLEQIAAMQEADLEMLSTAADAGLFSGIQALSDHLESALDATLVELGNELRRWRFAVAFSMRGILDQEPVERIDANVREILYGSEEATGPPVEVPDAVGDAMVTLIELSGHDLIAEETEEAIEHAAIVLAFLLGDVLPEVETGEESPP